MKKTIDVLQDNLSTIRAGRANPAILNKISVEYYGVSTPINQVAGISVPEARMIVIQPWDASILKSIEKAKLNPKMFELYERVFTDVSKYGLDKVIKGKNLDKLYYEYIK